MLDAKDDTVWTNAFYLAPVGPAFLVGPLQGLITAAASVFLAWRSGRYHTTYERDEQGGDVSAMLTYLAALGGVLASPWTLWALLAPVALGPVHERFVWAIDSYVATPIYILACLVVLALQAGPLAALGPTVLAALGGAIKWRDPGPKTRLHSLWHLCGGLSAALALFVLTL